MESTGSTTPKTSSTFRLLELPTEIIEFIFEYIALLDYEQTRSRRPNPTPIEALASIRNYRIRQLAGPLCYRRWDCLHEAVLRGEEYVMGPTRIVIPFAFARFCDQSMWGHQFRRTWPKIETLIWTSALTSFDDHLAVPWRSFPNLRHLEIRSPPTSNTTFEHDGSSAPNSLESICIGSSASLAWLERLSQSTSSIKHLTLVRTRLLRTELNRPFANWKVSRTWWSALQSLTLKLPAPSLKGKLTLEHFLDGFQPATMSSLQTLNIGESINQTKQSISRPLADILPSLARFSGGTLLSHLTLDIHFSCSPDELSSLASTFPTLRTLHLGDRLEWEGSRSDLIQALAPLLHLNTFSSRTLPDTPSSKFSNFPDSPLPNPSKPLAASPPSDDNIYCTPREMALELAAAVPKLSLVGWAGRSSDFDWCRIGKNEGGEPIQIDEVTLYSADLSRW